MEKDDKKGKTCTGEDWKKYVNFYRCSVHLEMFSLKSRCPSESGIHICRVVGRKYKKTEIGGRVIKVHRLVMEKHLGRKLSIDEVIHHKDGDIYNNQISNLYLTTSEEHTSNHGAGMKRPRKNTYDPPNKLKEETVKRIIALKRNNQHLNCSEISRMTGVCDFTIKRYLKKEGFYE